MRTWASVAIFLTVFVAAPTAWADNHTPAAVYSDFAVDGTLSCGHPQSALKAVLNDATVYQYGDPLTFIALKLAVRKQLAGGCRPGSERSLTLFTAGGNGNAGSTPPEKTSSAKSSVKEAASRPKGTTKEPAAPPTTADVLTSRRDGRMVLVGVGLLLVVLGAGGWAARHALTD